MVPASIGIVAAFPAQRRTIEDEGVAQFPLVHRAQTGGDLRRDFKYQLELQLAGAFDQIFECLPLYKLHRVEVALNRFCPGETPRRHSGDERWLQPALRVKNEGGPICHRETGR
jgi:hypothetical protein